MYFHVMSIYLNLPVKRQNSFDSFLFYLLKYKIDKNLVTVIAKGSLKESYHRNFDQNVLLIHSVSISFEI